MIDLDTSEVTVGDERQLSVTPDANLTKLEATFDPPSGEKTVYSLPDFDEDSGTYSLAHLFGEAGYWHVRIEAEAQVGQQAESAYVRAVSRETPDLEFFTRDVWPEYLSEEAMREDPTETMRLAEEAERRVIGRYREVSARTDDPLAFDTYGDVYHGDVQLDGFAEKDSSEQIDLEESDERLLDALRAAVANVIEWHAGRPDEAEHISRLDQGERRVDFRDKDLPSSVFSPLRPFDDRDPWY
ncbi:hypothetical protein GGP62_002173 [Salinibacter ruber]|uniref:hypothetical protein n=1 Tax=Salinibacter ruber TaxID=146919 RepID=UPI0021674EF4|nr:hypothetical protein [Salinibacter ruber]MCS3707186.1 hypothetical protein [Salinibacter ruber]